MLRGLRTLMKPFLAMAPRVLLRQGAILREAELRSVVEEVSIQRRGRTQPLLVWNEHLAGPLKDLYVTEEMARSQLRKDFSCVDVLRRAAVLLRLLRKKDLKAPERLTLTRQAFADTWPAVIVDSDQFLASLAARGQFPAVVADQGLLRIELDALRDPWPEPESPLLGVAADARFARLAMVMSAFDDESSFKPGDYTAQILVSLARMREQGEAISALVRLHELYVEILPQHLPEADAWFLRTYGIGLRDWIETACVLAHGLTTGLGPEVDTAQMEEVPGLQHVSPVLRSLSLDLEEMRTALVGKRGAEALGVIRERPFLRLMDHRLLTLHPDFVLSAVDDVTYLRLSNDSDPAIVGFAAVFGDVLEEYVGGILGRITSGLGPSASLARIPERKGTRKRCDWAWRVGDALVLIDSKRVGLSPGAVVGDHRLRRKIDKELGSACEQFCETMEDIKTTGIGAVVPGLSLPAPGWAPKRVVAWVIHHRPLGMWFNSPSQLLARTVGKDRWDSLFSGRPTFLTVAEAELLEARASQVNWDSLFAEFANEDPATFSGLDSYLYEKGYRGSPFSEFVRATLPKILSGEPTLPGPVEPAGAEK